MTRAIPPLAAATTSSTQLSVTDANIMQALESQDLRQEHGNTMKDAFDDLLMATPFEGTQPQHKPETAPAAGSPHRENAPPPAATGESDAFTEPASVSSSAAATLATAATDRNEDLGEASSSPSAVGPQRTLAARRQTRTSQRLLDRAATKPSMAHRTRKSQVRSPSEVRTQMREDNPGTPEQCEEMQLVLETPAPEESTSGSMPEPGQEMQLVLETPGPEESTDGSTQEPGQELQLVVEEPGSARIGWNVLAHDRPSPGSKDHADSERRHRELSEVLARILEGQEHIAHLLRCTAERQNEQGIAIRSQIAALAAETAGTRGETLETKRQTLEIKLQMEAQATQVYAQLRDLKRMTESLGKPARDAGGGQTNPPSPRRPASTRHAPPQQEQNRNPPVTAILQRPQPAVAAEAEALAEILSGAATRDQDVNAMDRDQDGLEQSQHAPRFEPGANTPNAPVASTAAPPWHVHPDRLDRLDSHHCDCPFGRWCAACEPTDRRAVREGVCGCSITESQHCPVCDDFRSWSREPRPHSDPAPPTDRVASCPQRRDVTGTNRTALGPRSGAPPSAAAPLAAAPVATAPAAGAPPRGAPPVVAAAAPGAPSLGPTLSSARVPSPPRGAPARPGPRASYASQAAKPPPEQDWQVVSSSRRVRPPAPSFPPHQPVPIDLRKLVVSRDGAAPCSPCVGNPKHRELEVTSAINRALNDLGIPKHTRLETLRVNARGTTTTVISREGWTAERLLSVAKDEMIRAARLVDPTIIDVVLCEDWARIKVEAIPVERYAPPGMLQRLSEELVAENVGLEITSEVRWSAGHRIEETARPHASVTFAVRKSTAAALLDRRFLSAAGTRYRVLPYGRTLPDSLCERCSGWGHLERNCPSTSAKCALCAGIHRTDKHACNVVDCDVEGTTCNHLIPMCANCNGRHTATNASCPAATLARKESAARRTLSQQSEGGRNPSPPTQTHRRRRRRQNGTPRAAGIPGAHYGPAETDSNPPAHC